MKRYLISADEAERKREEAGFRSLFVFDLNSEESDACEFRGHENV